MNEEEIKKITRTMNERFELVKTSEELEQIRLDYNSKKGIITELSTKMGSIPNEKKKEFGIILNELRSTFTKKYETLKKAFDDEKANKKLNQDKIDVTLPGTKLKRGSKHPISLIVEEIEDLFVSMGYDVVDGPEVESDHYNFELLNLPKGHPARDSQDSFYITEEMLLRTQTSPVQARTMEANTEKGPIRVICPGKTYRRDDDATHSHQFGQIEGLVIDKNISASDLKGTLEVLVKKVFGKDQKIRFRPSYFPFTEPSFEVDVSCFKCGGTGCNLCKKTGWIEILGSGMVHPNVLSMSGYDPNIYRGFAFGMGIERIAMLKYGIPDIRYLYTNDVRFLENFDRSDNE